MFLTKLLTFAVALVELELDEIVDVEVPGERALVEVLDHRLARDRQLVLPTLELAIFRNLETLDLVFLLPRFRRVFFLVLLVVFIVVFSRLPSQRPCRSILPPIETVLQTTSSHSKFQTGSIHSKSIKIEVDFNDQYQMNIIRKAINMSR